MNALAATTDSALSVAEPEFRVEQYQRNVASATAIDATALETAWTARGTAVSTVAPEHKTLTSVSVRSANPGSARSEVRQDRQNYVEGAISGQASDGLVNCTVKVGGLDVAISLPEECFEMSIEYGRPFKLIMVEKNGFKTPRVTPIPVSALSAADQTLYNDVMAL